MLVALLVGAIHFARGSSSPTQPLVATEPIPIGSDGINLSARKTVLDSPILRVSRIPTQRLLAQGYKLTMERPEAFAEAGTDEGK
jgi:hypothetical protein